MFLVAGLVLFAVVGSVIVAVPAAWVLMLVMGALHSVWPSLVNLSFINSWVIAFLFAITQARVWVKRTEG